MNDSLSDMRPLTAQEFELVKRMLESGSKEAAYFLDQLESLQATMWCCPCGCASFNFIVNGKEPSNSAPSHILGDFIFGSEDSPSGIFIFEKEGMLAGVEVYGLAGEAPKYLPRFEELRPS